MNDIAVRLRATGAELLALRDPLVGREPWPLSAVYGTEPEADWGPREVLAHIHEMVPYWTTQFRLILAGDPAGATPFGRVASDPARLAGIATDRELTVGVLLDRVGPELASAVAYLADLEPADLERRGLHQIQGELTVAASADRFLVTHVAGHVDQLRAILARRSGPA